MFARIKAEHANDMSELAMHRGLEHIVLPFPGEPFSEWVTFQFTNDNGRRTFEQLCQENDVPLDGQQVVDTMIDSVLDGVPADGIVEAMVTRKLTRGMANYYNKASQRAKYKCADCKNPIPKYSGRYPSKCPECGGVLNRSEALG
jgi:hypothetical protein